MRNYEQDYEYVGMLAKTWDLLRGDTSQWQDRLFYREFIDQQGGRVLDVGCGTGRLLLDYLADGVDIEGVDNSPEMLDICREKADAIGLKPTVYLQSMADLELPHRYRVIIVPSSSFQLVIEMGDARQTMENFFRHLVPGGLLIMPFMFLWQEGAPLDTGWVKDGEKKHPQDGFVIQRWSRAWYNLEKQLEHTGTRFEAFEGGEIVCSEYHNRSPATRWYTQHQALDLYLQSGFTDLKVYSGFSRDPAHAEDRIFSVAGVKPGN